MDAQAALANKPKYDDPCNGCGWCCMMEVCAIGKVAYGQEQQAPCPALTEANGRYWCGFVLTEDLNRLPPVIGNALGVGKGCCADTPNPERIDNE